METRSRKRAKASPSTPSSSSVGPTTRAAKRTRVSSYSSSKTAATPTTCSRTRSNISVSPATMDESSSRGGRRGRNHHGADKDNDKGKEKEHEVEKERENELGGLDVFDDDDDDNDNDDSEGGGGVGLLHQNLTSASSALQGLLRKLGAGLDDLLPSSAMGSASSSSHQSGRLKKILSGLRADGEDGKQVEALTQLCELLSIGTEDSLSTFSVDSFVPVLVGLLNYESNPDIMLLAARAITHLVDVLPSSCAAVVHYGAVNCFCARLLTIEYMDLAEQVFHTYILMYSLYAM